jgi:hypothetical protein
MNSIRSLNQEQLYLSDLDDFSLLMGGSPSLLVASGALSEWDAT